MILRDVIARIKAKCPIFETRVFGSAQLEEALRQAENVSVPTAFVMFDGDSPGENNADAGVIQAAQERWTVVAVVSNKDLRGQAASDGMHEVRRQLLSALLGWENAPDRDEDDVTNTDLDWGPIVYRGSLHIDMSAARLWHQFSFGHTIVFAGVNDGYEEIAALRKHREGDLSDYAGPAVRGGPAKLSDLDVFRDMKGQVVHRAPAPPVARPIDAPPAQPEKPFYLDDIYGIGEDDADPEG